MSFASLALSSSADEAPRDGFGFHIRFMANSKCSTFVMKNDMLKHIDDEMRIGNGQPVPRFSHVSLFPKECLDVLRKERRLGVEVQRVVDIE